MLQFPTNIFPQNVAVDANNAMDLTCVFNGDILTSVWYKAYDYYSGSIISTGNRSSNRRALDYNGGSGGVHLNHSAFVNGNDYAIQLMYTQSTADGTSNIYDMPIVRGDILSASGTSIMIADKIPNIYEWNVSSNICYPSTINDVVYAGAVLRVGAETRFINSYNRSTGQLIVDSAFESSIANKAYVILCNYLVTPQYYFMCRATPTLTITKALDRQGVAIPPEIIVTGAYSQTDGDMIRYYTLSIYGSRTEHDVSYTSSDKNLIQQSPKIYSQQIRFRFFNWFILQGNETIYYTVVCRLVTQNGESILSATEFSLTADNELIVCENLQARCINENEPDYLPQATLIPHYKKHQMVELAYSLTESGSMNEAPADLYRQDLETGIVTHLYAPPNPLSVEQKTYDWSVPNRGKFRYTILPRNRDTGIPYVASAISADVETKFMGYTIAKVVIDETSYSLPFMFLKESWEFAGEIDDTTTTQNLNRVVQAGHNRYTTMSSEEGNYLSSTLTCDIGYMSCSEKTFKDTIDMVNAWRDFISQDCIFMLKTQKGDVLLVNITGTPTVTYQENSPEIPAKISFDWVECDSIYNFIVRANGID